MLLVCAWQQRTFSLFKAAPMLVNSCRQGSCQWFHGDAQESNTPTMKPILTWWRKLMPSSISQVFFIGLLVKLFTIPLFQDLNKVPIASSFSPHLVVFVHLYGVCSCTGSTITAEIQGVIDACVKLTGMPDLTLSFMVSVLFQVFNKLLN